MLTEKYCYVHLCFPFLYGEYNSSVLCCVKLWSDRGSFTPTSYFSFVSLSESLKVSIYLACFRTIIGKLVKISILPKKISSSFIIYNFRIGNNLQSMNILILKMTLQCPVKIIGKTSPPNCNVHD